MGADLIIAYFGISKDANLKKVKSDLLKAIQDLNDKDKEEIANYWEGIGQDEVNKVEDINIDYNKELFSNIVKKVFTSIEEGYRDVSWIEYKGDIIYLTGGMSWGDNPTESYDDFYKFVNLPRKILGAGGVI